jgi:hypothetical protein
MGEMRERDKTYGKHKGIEGEEETIRRTNGKNGKGVGKQEAVEIINSHTFLTLFLQRCKSL